MKVYVENNENFESDDIIFKNITNVFDLEAIQKELEDKYHVVTEITPKRQISKDLWSIFIRSPYQGKNAKIGNDTKDAAKVALIVDYSTTGAMAISRSGADKQIMLLISSIANKHINEPFKYDKNIRSKL